MKSKFAIAAACAALWLYFVIVGQTPVAGFIDFLKDVLIGLGIYHTTMTNPTTPTQDAIDKSKEVADLPKKETP